MEEMIITLFDFLIFTDHQPYKVEILNQTTLQG